MQESRSFAEDSPVVPFSVVPELSGEHPHPLLPQLCDSGHIFGMPAAAEAHIPVYSRAGLLQMRSQYVPRSLLQIPGHIASVENRRIFEISKVSDERMYENKKQYYIRNGIDRRK